MYDLNDDLTDEEFICEVVDLPIVKVDNEKQVLFFYENDGTVEGEDNDPFFEMSLENLRKLKDVVDRFIMRLEQ